jgi:hypothetical protein
MTGPLWPPTPSNTRWLVGVLGVATILVAIVLVPIFDGEPRARYLGIVVTLLCFLNLAILVWRLDHTVSTIRRGEVGKQMFITAQITLWVIGFGIFSGSLWWTALVPAPAGGPATAAPQPPSAPSGWTVPLGDLGTPSMLVGLLLGMATLLALVVTLTEVRKDEIPHAMTFREALDEAAAFVEKYSDGSVTVRMCSYYPTIGAVTRRGYLEAYQRFVAALGKSRVEAVGLPLGSELPKDGEAIRKLMDRVCCSRPTTVIDAMGAFAGMWDPENDHELLVAQRLLSNAFDACKSVVQEMVGDAELDKERGPRWHATNRVPDYHFFVAVGKDKTPIRGFVLFGIRPAGMPIPAKRDETPPVVGMEVTDRTILRQLLGLWDDLRLHSTAHPGGTAAGGVGPAPEAPPVAATSGGPPSTAALAPMGGAGHAAATATPAPEAPAIVAAAGGVPETKTTAASAAVGGSEQEPGEKLAASPAAAGTDAPTLPRPAAPQSGRRS